MKTGLSPRYRILIAGAVLLAASCGGSDAGDTTGAPAETTTTEAPTTTSTTALTTTIPQTTTTSTIPGLASPGDYPVSDDYVMETILVDLDAAAGGLTLDLEGNLYTADFGYPTHDGMTVFKVDQSGNAEPFAAHESMDALTGNTFASDGSIYQSSFGSGYVFRIALDGTVEVLTDEMTGPTGIVLTDEGRLIVDDCNLNGVYEVMGDGTVELFAAGLQAGMRCPNGLIQDPEGNFYVVNFNNGLLLKISPDGEEIIQLHRFPGDNAHVAYHEGQLFITAREDHRVYRYDLETGDVDVVAGTGEPGYEDGPGAEATFGRPNAIVVDAEGNLYLNHGSGAANNPTAIRVLRPVS